MSPTPPETVAGSTLAESPESSKTSIVPNVIFPEGEFWSDEPPLESDQHREQIDLLIRLLKWWWRERQDSYVSGNLTIYYSPQQLKSEDFRGPDFFAVLDAEPRDRRSWVVWQEGGKYPNVVIELLSDSTASVDRGLKKQIYQDIWRVPNYFWFHPETFEFQCFHMVQGVYEPLLPSPSGKLWSEQLGLFLGIHQQQLRFFTAEEGLIALPEEAALEQLEAKAQALEQERRRADRLAEKLRTVGIDPDAQD